MTSHAHRVILWISICQIGKHVKTQGMTCPTSGETYYHMSSQWFLILHVLFDLICIISIIILIHEKQRK